MFLTLGRMMRDRRSRTWEKVGFKRCCPQGLILRCALQGLGLAYHLRPILKVCLWLQRESFTACHPRPGLVTATEVRFVISPSLVRSPSPSNTRSSLSPRSSAELSDEMNGKTHYRSSWPMMKRCRGWRRGGREGRWWWGGGREDEEEKAAVEEGGRGGGRGGTAKRDNLLPAHGGDKSRLSPVSGSVCRGGRGG